jgi:hypothetical protein
MPDADESVYRVEPTQERFSVLDESNRVIVVCRDKGSAEQYATLLNAAFRKGFKAGYSQGKGHPEKSSDE